MATVSAQFSTMSAWCDTLSNTASDALSVANAASNAASVVSTAASNALSVANAASNAASVVSQAVSIVSQAVSVVSQAVSVGDAALSVRIDTQSQSISVLSQALSIISQRVSAGVGASAQTRSRNAANTVSGSALVDIASMSVSCQAGLNIIHGGLIFEALTSGGFAFGVSTPALAAQGSFVNFWITSVTGQNTAQPTGAAVMSAVAAGQTAVASVSIATINSPRNLVIEAMINASAAGSFQLMGKASAAAAQMIVRAGYLRVFQL